MVLSSYNNTVTKLNYSAKTWQIYGVWVVFNSYHKFDEYTVQYFYISGWKSKEAEKFLCHFYLIKMKAQSDIMLLLGGYAKTLKKYTNHLNIFFKNSVTNMFLIWWVTPYFMPSHYMNQIEVQLEKDCCVIVKLWSGPLTPSTVHAYSFKIPAYLKEFVDPFFYDNSHLALRKHNIISHMSVWTCTLLVFI